MGLVFVSFVCLLLIVVKKLIIAVGFLGILKFGYVVKLNWYINLDFFFCEI